MKIRINLFLILKQNNEFIFRLSQPKEKQESVNVMSNRRLKNIFNGAKFLENLGNNCTRHTYFYAALGAVVDLMSLLKVDSHSDLKLLKKENFHIYI